MNIPYVMKKCSKCGRWLVASTVNFHRDKGCKYGLHSKCKECISKYSKRYCEANRDKKAKYNKQWHKANRHEACEQNKRYYEANKEKVLEQQKQYKQTPQGQAVRFNSSNKRRRKKEAQGTGVTGEQWREMMKFFDWKCAYSGKRLTNKTRSIDHIVPLNSGGDNMIWNCVPMTKSLNSSKNDKDMLEWYEEQSFYNPNRLAKIYEWQEYAFNKWGKDTDYFNTNDIQIKLI